MHWLFDDICCIPSGRPPEDTPKEPCISGILLSYTEIYISTNLHFYPTNLTKRALLQEEEIIL